MARYLRYAAAVIFALLAVGFVALWVRSWLRDEYVQGPMTERAFFGIRSCYGVGIFELTITENMPAVWREWTFKSERIYPLNESFTYWQVERSFLGLGFRLNAKQGVVGMVPHWFLAASSLAVSALLAFKPIRRFTVRGLLITTAVIAAAFGALVYYKKRGHSTFSGSCRCASPFGEVKSRQRGRTESD